MALGNSFIKDVTFPRILNEDNLADVIKDVGNEKSML